MPARGWRSSVVVLSAVILAVGGCTDSEPGATTPTTSVAVTTTLPQTTTTLEAGPQPLVSGSLLEPGEYVTTVFEPTVMYRIERSHPLRAFQNGLTTAVENTGNRQLDLGESLSYRGVAVHRIWHGLTPEEVLAELEEIQQIDLGQADTTEIGGFPGRRIKAQVKNRVSLWAPATGGDAHDETWWVQRGPLDFIILDTPAGTLLITIQAPAEEWDDFLPIAEEILAGISFPDMESG